MSPRIVFAQTSTPTPSPTPSITRTPTFTRTPTSTGTPTNTPTATPTFDIGVTNVTVNTIYLVDNIPSRTHIRGSFDLALSRPADVVDTTVRFKVRDSTGTVWIETDQIYTATQLKIHPITFAIPAPTTFTLPIRGYHMVVEIDPNNDYGEGDRSNNVLASPLKALVHVSGRVWYDDILTNITTLGSIAGTPLNLNGGGEINGIPIGYLNIQVVRDDNTRDLKVVNGFTNFDLPDPYQPGNFSYIYNSEVLTPTGASANIAVVLPPEMSWREYPPTAFTYTFNKDPITFNNVDLNQDFTVRGTLSHNFPLTFFWESLAYYVHTTGHVFSEAGFQLLGPQMEYWHVAKFKSPLGQGELAANDAIYNTTATFDGEVWMTNKGLNAHLLLEDNIHVPSWPITFAYSHGKIDMTWKDGRIDETKSRIPINRLVSLYFSKDCGPNLGLTGRIFDVSETFPIFPDGGIFGATTVADYSYQFNTYNFPVNSAFRMYFPGYRVLPTNYPGARNAIDQYLICPRDPVKHELYYYSSKKLLDGDGYYAGLTLERQDLMGKQVTVQIDSNPTPLDLTLNDGSKLYIRGSGFTGTIDAGFIPNGNLMLYPQPACGGKPYDVLLTRFGQALLSNSSKGQDSKIDGKVDIPWPSDIEVPFEKMELNGCGNFEGGEIPASEQETTRTLAYWIADLNLITMGFEKRLPNSQDNDRTLWVSSVNTVEKLDKKPVMQINILSCGDLGDSRIREPLTAVMEGYTYQISKIYLTKWDGNPNTPNGFYNVLGDLKFPFFGMTHAHALIKSGVEYVADGDPWFASGNEDTNRDGFPNAYVPPAGTVVNKIIAYSAADLVNVDKKVLGGIVNLAYDVKYNNGDNRFRSPGDQGEDLVVINVESSVENLTPTHVEIKFGIKYDGLPELNLQSIAGDYAAEVQNTFLAPVRDSLDDLADRLGGDFSGLLRNAIKSAIQPEVTAFVNQFKSQIAGAKNQAEYNAIIAAQLPGLITNLQSAMDLKGYFQNVTNPALNTIDETLDILESTKNALKFNPGQLDGLLGSVVDFALDALGQNSNLGLNEFLAELEKVRQRVLNTIQNDIEPPLKDARDYFNNPLNTLNVFTTARITSMKSDINNRLFSAFNTMPLLAAKNLDPNEITTYILSEISSSEAMRSLNTLATNKLFDVKDKLLNEAQNILSGVNEIAMEYVNEAGGFINDYLRDFNDVLGLKAAEIRGYAQIQGETLEKLHMDIEAHFSLPDEMVFNAYLDMIRYQVKNSGKNCFADLDPNTEVTDIRIGANDVDLSWLINDVKAENVEIKLMLLNGELANVGGQIIIDGKINFEVVSFNNLQFGVAVGKVENYLWASGTAKFDSYSLGGGIFIGTSCDIEPLKKIDPKVSKILPITELRGVYARVQGTFSIIDFSCMLRAGASAGVAAWYFADGPTFGGKLIGGIYGEALCIVSVRGQIELIGAKSGDVYIFNGLAWVAGGIGFCDPEDWDSVSDVWDDDWCYTCVVYVDITFKNTISGLASGDTGDWDVDYDADCE